MKPVRNKSAAFSMLELVVATAMLTTVMTSVIVLVRTSYTAWESHEQDIERTENVYGMLRYITRRIRQANAVTSIQKPADASHRLTILMPDGSSYMWEKPDGSNTVGVIRTNPMNIETMAENITELDFAGYEADGVTQTTVEEDIQLVECRAKTILLHGAGEERIVTCRAWLRSW